MGGAFRFIFNLGGAVAVTAALVAPLVALGFGVRAILPPEGRRLAFNIFVAAWIVLAIGGVIVTVAPFVLQIFYR